MSMADDLAGRISAAIMNRDPVALRPDEFLVDSKIAGCMADQHCEICGVEYSYNPTDDTTLICKRCVGEFPEHADPKENEFCIAGAAGVFLVRVVKIK
jgi:hypothetical protein